MQVSLYGQELLPPAHIKTLQFYATEDTQAQFPIVTLGQSFTLSFDDLQKCPALFLTSLVGFQSQASDFRKLPQMVAYFVLLPP